MDFQALKTAYTAQHWRSIDDTARMHLTGFAAFCAAEAERANTPEAEPEAPAVEQPAEEPAPETPPIPDTAPADPQPAPAA